MDRQISSSLDGRVDLASDLTRRDNRSVDGPRAALASTDELIS